MNKKQAIIVLSDIVTGKGRIAELVKQHPEIQTLSQDNVRNHFGNHFPVFRFIGVQQNKNLQQDKIVSVSTSLKSVASIMTHAPGAVFSRDKLITTTSHILRYDISIDEVIADIPVLAKIASTLIKKQHINDPRSGKVSLEAILNASKKENELIVNLTKIKPSIAVSLKMSHDKSMFYDFINGEFTDVATEIKNLKQRGVYFNNNEEFVSIVSDFKTQLDALTK